MRRIGVETDEFILRDLGTAGRSFQLQCGIQRSLILGKALFQDRNCIGLFCQDTLCGDLTDVGGGPNPPSESVFWRSEGSTLGPIAAKFCCEVTMIQAGAIDLLGPEQVLADPSELLYSGLQVLNCVTGHFINHENQGFARTTTRRNLKSAYQRPVCVNRGISHGWILGPCISSGIGSRVQGVQHGTRKRHPHAHFCGPVASQDYGLPRTWQ